ncbi:DUF3810 domain-containing protein [Mucilaginibacter terrenus]|uniref:DUF3810 domain-containing protein n=1 Tax=Mucilaginibacter terrenus TaxID=2482727 RepID=A0A3E2NQT2_9SPHI|nr:DUF3810 domain-containing protein [Mucilaginibacter terrenus]RFZ83352.1 DUF3810 domain-containing protein [Mucilaginibacter terrenus]
MNRYLSDKPLLKRGIAILVLTLAIIVLMIFAGHPYAVEKYYSQGLYSVICYILHPVLNIFPFSIGDVMYIGVIGYLIYLVVLLIKHLFKKHFARAGSLVLGLIIGVQVGILLFYLLWGLNYFRPSAAERLNLKAERFTVAELQQVTTTLIDSANTTRSRLSEADLSQTNDTIYNRAKEAVLRLSGSSVNYRTYRPGVKPSLLTPLLNYISTSGYYNPFTTEAQVNYEQPLFARPFVACHEMSHQMGFGAEDEANFAGFMAAIASKDKLLRYSAYHLAVGEFMITLRGADSTVHKQLKTRVSAAVKADFKAEREYWLAYQNKAEVITGLFYDRFLKVNNQPQGLDTYNQMVTLVMALYRKK